MKEEVQNDVMFYVIDTETTMRADPDIYGYSASPAYRKNEIVLLACLSGCLSSPETRINYVRRTDLKIADVYTILLKNPGVVVGHNLAFDIAHLVAFVGYASAGVQSASVLSALYGGGRFWDTAIAEYVMTGQQTRMPSLQSLCAKYGVPGKVEAVSNMIAEGVSPEKIDPDLLKKYITADVTATEAVFRKQWSLLANNPLMRGLIMDLSRASAFYGVAELYGLYIHRDGLAALRDKLASFVRDLEKALSDYAVSEVCKVVPDLKEEHVRLNATSNRTVAALLYGGPVVYEHFGDPPSPRRRTKSGWYKKTATIPPTWFAGYRKRTPSGETAVDYRTLVDLINEPATEAGPIRIQMYLRNVIMWRESIKLQSTYVEPIWQKTYGDKREVKAGTVHARIHATTTATGRTSSSGPNIQNLPPEIEELIVPRYPNGAIVKCDFQQLEMCALAELSNDRQLIEDITNGVDIHYETGKKVFGWLDPSQVRKDARTLVKRINFGLVYGAGPATLSRQTGQPMDVVKGCIASFYERYPTVKRWQQQVRERANAVAAVVPFTFTPNGNQVKEAFLRNPTGRLLRFVTRDDFKGGASFSPTELANYPVQSLATGDWVQQFLCFCAPVLAKYTAWLVNVVHDSYWIELVVAGDVDDLKRDLDEQLVVFCKSRGLRVPLRLAYNVVLTPKKEVTENA